LESRPTESGAATIANVIDSVSPGAQVGNGPVDIILTQLEAAE